MEFYGRYKVHWNVDGRIGYSIDIPQSQVRPSPWVKSQTVVVTEGKKLVYYIRVHGQTYEQTMEVNARWRKGMVMMKEVEILSTGELVLDLISIRRRSSVRSIVTPPTPPPIPIPISAPSPVPAPAPVPAPVTTPTSVKTQQCQGVTKEGLPCRRRQVGAYCRHHHTHDDDNEHDHGDVVHRCLGTNKDGKRCKRKTKNSDFCHRHQ